MKPSDIRFTQETIQATFTNDRTLLSTLKQVLAKTVTPDSINTIHIVRIKRIKGRYYVLSEQQKTVFYKKLEDINSNKFINC